MAMAGVVLAAVVAAAGVGGYALHTWRSVQIRRCECSETIARIENPGAADKKVGF